MASFIAENDQYGLEETGRTVTVPNNPKAKLMYYLDCVSTVLQLNNPNLARLKNFSNYQYLSEPETDALLRLVILLSPDELIGKVFFQSEALCRNSGNTFFEITKVSHLLAVTNSVIVGGERKRVVNIMTYKPVWMRNNYFIPLSSYQYRLSRMARGLPGYEQAPSTSCTIL